MFFPIHDDNPIRRFPAVTVALIAVNAAMFIYELSLGERLAGFVQAFGAIPAEIIGPGLTDIEAGPAGIAAGPPEILTLVTSMFLHGGVMHILGNMVYLWIFGNNIEDVLGPLRFLLFYLAGGLAAGLSHVLLSPVSTVPTIGASGAVSAVLGAYLVLYPKARVRALLFLGILMRVIWVPAVVLLVFWFVIQVFSGVASFGSGGEGGVAWFAHIGGFVAGMLFILPKRLSRHWRAR